MSDQFKERHPNGDVPIVRLQQRVDEWIRTVGVDYFDPLTNTVILAEEVGEVARIIARRYGQQSEKEGDRGHDLGEELSDVIFVVCCLANQTGTDLAAAFDRKMDRRTERDQERHARNPKLRRD
ncbi:MAG: nucleotide pyrophosphohydrolase [Flavobacteriales bacterium]|nr:nucleotide pyrophosphohydrolase [Flavobacteriales bacterium]MCB9165859.1 nucleotide pyrophosphohydrolase [Flavobacteriales bacterium]